MKFFLTIVTIVFCFIQALKSQEKIIAKDKTHVFKVIDSYILLMHKKVKLPKFVLTLHEAQNFISGGYGFNHGENVVRINYPQFSIYYYNGSYYFCGKRFATENNDILYKDGHLWSDGKKIKYLEHIVNDLENLKGKTNEDIDLTNNKFDWDGYIFKTKTQGKPVSLNPIPLSKGRFYFSVFWISGEIKDGSLYVFGKYISKVKAEIFLDFSSDKLYLDNKFICNLSEIINK
ncbi:MAG: hypothetical protein ACSHX6_00765 [Akkermansiaceae bacterium]